MRLSNETLDRVPADVGRPGYDRAAARAGVVHLGLGAFHRAHQAVVFDDAMAAGDPRWMVTGASLRSPDARDRSAPQDGLYALLVRDGAGERVRVVGSVRDVLVVPDDPAATVARLARPDTHLVTLTVTEKGYKLDRSGGGLLRDDADVAHDLSGGAPRTAPGLIAAGLAARRSAGLAPFTALSCDNLPDNGALLKAAVLEMADALDPALAAWVAAEGAFPATMVDRIVPAADAGVLAAARDRLGMEDLGALATEPFWQWVVEDRFCGPRPDFASLGVQLTDRVGPWEDAKLRLLNGAHSGIAYLGGLAGDDFVHEFVERPEGARFVERLWDQAAATLSPPEGMDVVAYRRDLMARFRNPSLRHRTRQIAMDGSQKLPQRLVATMRDAAARGGALDALALAVAGWMRWQAGRTDGGEAFAVDDPLADRLAAARSGGAPALLAAIGAQLEPGALDAVTRALTVLEERGAAAAVATLET